MVLVFFLIIIMPNLLVGSQAKLSSPLSETLEKTQNNQTLLEKSAQSLESIKDKVAHLSEEAMELLRLKEAAATRAKAEAEKAKRDAEALRIANQQLIAISNAKKKKKGNHSISPFNVIILGMITGGVGACVGYYLKVIPKPPEPTRQIISIVFKWGSQISLKVVKNTVNATAEVVQKPIFCGATSGINFVLPK